MCHAAASTLYTYDIYMHKHVIVCMYIQLKTARESHKNPNVWEKPSHGVIYCIFVDTDYTENTKFILHDKERHFIVLAREAQDTLILGT